MLNKIILLSIHNKLIVMLIVLLMAAAGIYSATQIPLDAVPDITNNQVQIITKTPALAAPEVEQYITTPLERALSSVPGHTELRSISRFGLSVITIVFQDDIDILKCRQLVTEQLNSVSTEISAFGTPELGPMTTGLGEIYQYVLETDPGYESKYDLSALRTLQDWVVKRQLAGTPGVVDVSSFGGKVKQYEIKVDPERLTRLGISVADVFKAMQSNNANSGGGYIEKEGRLNFIRTEGMVRSLEDIENTPVMHKNGVFLRIRDVAEVGFGSALRYGAMTQNGKGETTGGIVMMLKGENSASVIKAVKERIAIIQKSMPKGVVIRPFLDRTKLVNRALGTVEKNLLEGGLIVIVVIFLLLGDWRASIIVASVIPLALLFALILMQQFGISANLMSLGAIDFGLVADGSVIVAEAAVAALAMVGHHHKMKLSQLQRDQITYTSASAIRSSAAFGEIIIIIVYIPILTLQGIEGKMFKPMAQTVSFALIGALLLSLTYVPAACALWLRPNPNHENSLAGRLTAYIAKAYMPILKWCIRKPAVVLSAAGLLLAVAVGLFLNIGGEFLPELEEGDFAVETRGPSGSGPDRMKGLTTQAELILKKFPEVEEVVSKIGTSEIPVDPMPVENADIIVVLKEKDQWPEAISQDELAGRMEDSLAAMPGVAYEFQQPISMRFNELMTGSKSDVAVKIYGNNIPTLLQLAHQINALSNGIEGISNVKVEQVEGMPQLLISIKRDALVRYGITVDDANKLVAAAMGGAEAGVVYEDDRRFGLVFRLDSTLRAQTETIGNLPIITQEGQVVPLSEIAEIKEEKMPVQISHDRAQRVITVGVNVSGRDVESVIKDLSAKLDKSLSLPIGYSLHYGGQFENLVKAKARLSIMVPLALVLILVLLYLTFNSIKQSILIFSAIPLSAVGGIIALTARGMPFSISAGVGFIALFGVAVLNGLVLMGAINHHAQAGLQNSAMQAMRACYSRLRPVIITATVAALGFLPMALTTSGGAEVQRPLATVVIGGIVSAALLTLLVLPVLHVIFNRPIKITVSKKLLTIVALLLVSGGVMAQSMTLADAERKLVSGNLSLKAASLQVMAATKEKQSWLDLPKLNADLQYGETQFPGVNDYTISVQQAMNWPGYYGSYKKLLNLQAEGTTVNQSLLKLSLLQQLRIIWQQWEYQDYLKKQYLMQDSLYARWSKTTQVRYKQGDIPKVLAITANSRRGLIGQRIVLLEAEKLNLEALLKVLIGEDITQIASESKNYDFGSLPDSIGNHPYFQALQIQSYHANRMADLEKQKLMPELRVGYLNQSIEKKSGQQVITAGVGIPLLSRGQQVRMQVAKIQAKAVETTTNQARLSLQGEYKQAKQEYLKQLIQLKYYENTALAEADEMQRYSWETFQAGEIDFSDYLLSLEQSFRIREQYLTAKWAYNKACVQLQYYLNPNE